MTVCYATIIVHYAHSTVTSVLVLFVIFGSLLKFDWYLGTLLFATLVTYPMARMPVCLVMFTVNDSEIVACGHELTLV